MIILMRRIRANASDMLATTSRNDPHRAKLQETIDLCDEILDHYIDDGR